VKSIFRLPPANPGPFGSRRANGRQTSSNVPFGSPVLYGFVQHTPLSTGVCLARRAGTLSATFDFALFRSLCALWFLVSTAAAAQADVRADVHDALEANAPLPSHRLTFPTPGSPDVRTSRRAAETAKEPGNDAKNRGQAEALTHLPSAALDARGNLGNAGQSAAGQARAEEAKRNSRAQKPKPMPPKP
jgi:hypothetical protein